MRRIAGIINFDQTSVNSNVIEQMLVVMKNHRNNEQSTWVHEDVGLGWTSISGQCGSFLLRDRLNDSLVVTFDGRIDNRKELLDVLKSILEEKDLSISNEEILLAAYLKWGCECPKYLVGDFAFAIWDEKNHQLFCVRDHFGVKPFYYYSSEKVFVFASTPQGLLASLRVPNMIDEERIADLLMEFAGGGLEAVDKTSSFYKNVFRLPPAHMLIVRPTGVVLQRYWELSPVHEIEYKKESEYLESFEELFYNAVRCRLGNATTPASMLSGGIDSAAIVGMGRKILKEEGKLLHAFAATPNSVGPNREYQHIFSVLNQGNLLPHLISETELLLQLDKLVGAIKEENDPFDCLMNLNRAIYLDAKEQGVNIILDGVDGDLLLSRSFYITPLWQQGAFRTILDETLMADGFTAEYKLGGSYILDSFLSVFTPYTPKFIRRIYRQRRCQSKVTSLIEDLIIDHEFAGGIKLYDRIVKLHSYQQLPASRS